MLTNPGRTRLGRFILSWLVTVLAVPLPAMAQIVCPPGQIPQFIGGQVFCVPEGGVGNDTAPDQLVNRSQILGGRHFATDDQITAILALSEQAVANTATSHQVPT